jgi:charged multivesicular body protein 1
VPRVSSQRATISTNPHLPQFTAKQLNRQAAKAGKDETAERAKLKKAIQAGHTDIAKIYAQNAIRKQNEKLNLLRLGSRLDAVSSRVQTAVTMRSVTGSMTNVVKGMDVAMKSMDLEKVRSSGALGKGAERLLTGF